MLPLLLRLTDFLHKAEFIEPRYQWSQYEALDPSIETEENAAWLVAILIVRLRCGGSPHLFTAWMDRISGGPPLPQVEHQVLVEQLTEDLSPGGNETHLQGLVVEHIWYALTREWLMETGRLVRIEEPSWAVIDHGADGIAVYKDGDCLSFALWESKQHEARTPIRATVQRACVQLELRAARYLARASKVAQTIADDVALAELYGRMSELWIRGDPRAHVGIHVTSSLAAVEQRAFAALPDHFEALTGDDQREGILARFHDFPAFARRVRDIIWIGL